MTFAKFSSQVSLNDETEINKIKYLAYYFRVKNNHLEFTLEDIKDWFITKLHHTTPNVYRIKQKLLKSVDFVKGSQKDHFKLNSKCFAKLEDQLKLSTSTSEEIETINSILPETLYANTRGFIETLSKQINASYENNIFDGCAVIMRRLLEVCLILAYQKISIETAIQNPDGSYKMLDGIINDAVTNPKLSLSKDSKATLHDFKELGNFSAHKIYYNCRKSEIELVARKYRATIEELLYKSGLFK
jgi:hypothetical protein